VCIACTSDSLAIRRRCATVAKTLHIVVISFTNMIQDRIAKIEATLSNSPNIPAETREELLILLAELKAEVGPLAATHGAEVESITDMTGAAVESATSREQQPEQTAEALEGLASSVRDFEASHPRLVQIVDRLALTLSNMGI